jgi:hypothetical protein
MCFVDGIAFSDFELWAALIRSDHAATGSSPLLQANPQFARWYCEQYLPQQHELPDGTDKAA